MSSGDNASIEQEASKMESNPNSPHQQSMETTLPAKQDDEAEDTGNEEAADVSNPPLDQSLQEDNHQGMKRVQLTESQNFSKEDILQLWKEQEAYIDHLEAKLKSNKKEGAEIEEDEDVVPQKGLESNRREQLLIMKLATKEQELQEVNSQLASLKAAQAPSAAMLQSTLLDPAVNILIQKLTKEVDNLRKEAEERQNEMAAWKFTSDSAAGKKLMAKCRQLLQENEEIGKMISSGRLAKLEGELEIQKNLTQQMKQNQLELDEFMAELDEDVEGMQCTILMLQNQLRESKEENAKMTDQLARLGVKKEDIIDDDFKEDKTGFAAEKRGIALESEEMDDDRKKLNTGVSAGSYS